MSIKHSYQGNLQERLRNLSMRTNCPTRQENGQRYLGPPIDWTAKAPSNAEIFISKLPADCYEDEIYDFCAQIGKIYLIRLMINFENENRGFCFVTFSSPKEASEAVASLPQNALRKGHYIHAEISFNNCTLKMYGLDFRWNDESLEQEIRANTKDVVNVTIKRNMAQRTLMATLYFDTHQKAAIARRKLSQIANSRWGQNVKVFLWSKKLQNKGIGKRDYINEKTCDRKKSSDSSDNESPLKEKIHDFEESFARNNYEDFNSPSSKNFTLETSQLQDFSAWSNSPIFSPSKQSYNYADNFLAPKLDNTYDNNYSSIDRFKTSDSSHFDAFSCLNKSPSLTRALATPVKNSSGNWDNACNSLFSQSHESSPAGRSNSSTSDDSETYSLFGTNWNNDRDIEQNCHSNEPSFANDSQTLPQFYCNIPERQIATILQEALEALALNNLDEMDQQRHFFF